MIVLAELAWVARLVALIGGAALLGLGLAHFVWRRRRALAAVARIEDLARQGYAGFDVVPIYGDEWGLALVTRNSAPAGSAFLLDTEPNAGLPDGLADLQLGVSALDTPFRTRGASEAAARGLAASQTQLAAASGFLAGWWGRLGRVSVSTNEVRFLFYQDQLTLFERALPAMAHFAGILLSAVRYYPPTKIVAPARGAFRAAGADTETAGWSVEAPEGRVGPFTLPELIELLQQGRVSWLTRASVGDSGPLLPLAAHDALAPARVPVVDQAARQLPSPTAPLRRAATAVLALSQLYSVAGVLWLMFIIASLFAAPNLERAADGQASASWPSTSGRILSSRLDTEYDSDDRPRYSADIRYEYKVNGARYFGDRVLFYYCWRFEGYTYARDAEQSVVSAYPVNKEVRVFYQPSAPQNSVLRPGLVPDELAAGAVALGFVALAILLLLLQVLSRAHVWRLRRQADRAATVLQPRACSTRSS